MESASHSSTGDWRHDGFAHEAFVYDDDGDAMARCVPFVAEGLDYGEPVIVVAGRPIREALKARFGPVLPHAMAVEAAESWWRGGQATLAAYAEQLVALQATGRPWRLIGEPVWLTLPGGALWNRYEAVANTAFASYRYYFLCLYDARRLGRSATAEALRTHPLYWDGAAPVPSPSYEPTADYLTSVEPQWVRPPSERATVSLTDPTHTRAIMRASLNVDAWGRRVDDMLLAVHELVINAVSAAGSARVSWWLDGEWLIWEVADSGPGMHDPIGGYVPPQNLEDDMRGLWMARSLADDASIRPEGPGTSVRLFFRRAV